jgi:hypothetical protein
MLIVGSLGYRPNQESAAIGNLRQLSKPSYAKITEYQLVVNNDIVLGALSRSTEGVNQMHQRADEWRTKINKLMQEYEPTVDT